MNPQEGEHQHAPSSRVIRSLIDEVLGFLLGELRNHIYEYSILVVKTRIRLDYSIRAFSEDPLALPPMNSWDVSMITDFSDVFAFQYFFNEYIGGWEMSQATNMCSMFQGCRNFNQDLSEWDVYKGLRLYETSSALKGIQQHMCTLVQCSLCSIAHFYEAISI